MCQTLFGIIAFAPKIPENVVLYRLASPQFINQLIEKYQENMLVIEEGFLSTSLLKSITEAGSENGTYTQSTNLLKLYVKKGTAGVYVPLVVGRLHEQEMLLLPGAYIRLIEDPYEQEGYTIYECELINMTVI